MYNNDSSQRTMHDVSSMNLTCATCGAAITKLPFMPEPGRALYCQDCNAQRRRSTSGPREGGRFNDRGPRQMHDVTSMNIKCAGCDKAITELPFMPDPSKAIYCRDCFRSQRGN